MDNEKTQALMKDDLPNSIISKEFFKHGSSQLLKAIDMVILSEGVEIHVRIILGKAYTLVRND